MARKNASPELDEELEERTRDAAAAPPPRRRSFDDSPLDARPDLDLETESPFLRGQKRIQARRGALPQKALARAKFTLLAMVVGGCLLVCGLTLYRYTTHSWRFRVDSSDNIEITGNHNISRPQILEVFGGDIDRNIFYVPLDERKQQLEQMPWIQSAAVMRFLPNRLKVVVKERTPVAFAQVGSRIALIDANGVIMEMAPGQQANYSFPVIVGISDTEPLSTRAAQMKIYAELIRQLDSGDAHYSQNLSDIDLSDPDDVKATVADPHGAVLVHFGSENFLERFKVYVAHVQEWRMQFARLQSVDLRYEHQVIVNPDSAGPETSQQSESGPSGGDEKNTAAAQKKPAARTKTKKH